jgi:integrase
LKKPSLKKTALFPYPKRWPPRSPITWPYAVSCGELIPIDPNPYLLAASKQKSFYDEFIRRRFHQAVSDIGLKRPRQTIGNTNIGAPTPHSLRHSFAANTLKRIKEKGKSPQHALPVLAAYLGHSEYKHTTKYLKMLDAEHRHQLVNFISTQRHNP